jgi:hypothetical protein
MEGQGEHRYISKIPLLVIKFSAQNEGETPSTKNAEPVLPFSYAFVFAYKSRVSQGLLTVVS